MLPSIPISEVVQLLRHVAHGEILAALPVPRPDPDRDVYPGLRWDEVLIGEVTFLMDGYEVVLFVRNNRLRYVSSVIAPDSRRATYEDWKTAEVREPGDYLTDEERRALTAVLRSIRSTMTESGA